MDFRLVMALISRWAGTLKFFPADPDSRIGIAKAIAKMAKSENQVLWLVEVLPTIYTEWPAAKELRAVFCMKFKPADGIEAVSEVYPNGLTVEELNPGRPTPRQIAGERQEPVTEDSEMAARNPTLRPPPPPEEWSRLNSGETDLQGLTRSSEQFRRAAAAVIPRPATQAEIDAVRVYQEAHRGRGQRGF